MMALRQLILTLALTVVSAVQVRAQSERSVHFTARQCNEDAIAIHVDPGPLQDFVDGAFSLALEEGKARILIVVHDCGQYWLDGVDVGPTQEAQFWVALHGPQDVRPVIGAERTLPTRTWFNLLSLSNNARVREAKGGSGTVQLPIEGIALDPPASRRGGRMKIRQDVELTWTVASAAPAARLVGINHDVFGRDAAGKLFLNRIQVLVHPTAAPSSGTLKVVGELNALPWIPPGSYPAVIQTFFPIWSRAALGLVPPATGETSLR